MRVLVTCQSFNPQTGIENGDSSDEIIDTETNNLFKNCKTLTDIVESYQSFWNRLPTIQKELVLVQKIQIQDEDSK